MKTGNERLAMAILAVRICGRDPATMAEVRDALAMRRNARDYLGGPVAKAIRLAIASDMRAYGRQERTQAEILRGQEVVQ